MSVVRDKANCRISALKSLLCVGLDSDPEKIPAVFLPYENPVLEFNRAVIRATSDVAIAYKLNTAFYEARGIAGLLDMEKTLGSIPDVCMTIADAKRADIGNTSKMYAQAFFDHWSFDALTVAPYMGFDSLEPFFAYEDKLLFVLCLTSNEGSVDFEEQAMQDGRPLYRSVLDKVASWNRNGNGGVVVGATKSALLSEIRCEAPNLFLLIPGVGAQGGSLEDTVHFGVDANRQSAVINVSRSLIYPSGSFSGIDDYERAVAAEASKMHSVMKAIL
ncbi:orotidine-5'-phosphate decarboxylase [Pelodictyon phaeoclathratiforme]|jgi:orotidine-5'-phosphate decarboxylase|uniref:Orotidine-5'-phosphate decarboxylase n=1 Tax=Pelodictyon phaeoclathratiforme (strain DSM 5477 / BU-1) TaxID=324925 RepID=B4SAR9_PELPB|nr:orotidine-5'-phosphate decarboxylase [Pelodictyon phaeoclathratiforme]ACF42438.1 orotidine 5'-phosphate decarboxylase [Pelodictyon phaeoclathratiforme BU-1]MBV5288867.1 orotidine-5'-phosphate decarboxylase [Pelodictyon phaeoclathratiforme]